MAVYTHLGAEELAALVGAYDVGDLVSAKGIAEGVSNSNWLIETTRARFILTLYERRIEIADLPWFLGLLDHLAAAGCPVPRTIHDRAGAAFRMVGEKAAALIEFLPGVSPTVPTTQQAHAVGAALARVHLSGRDYGPRRDNPLDLAHSVAVLEDIGAERLGSISCTLDPVPVRAREIMAQWPRDLPESTAHTDLFPDNVLMLGGQVTGMIDFYFACHDAMAYDLAVTHAAWCFDRAGGTFDAAISRALFAGYQSVRTLEAAELAALPILAQGACLRFIASRAEDWLATPPGALVERKDPVAFLRRLDFYAETGAAAFA